MSSRVVTIGDGVKLTYQKDPRNRRISKLVKVDIPPALKNKTQEIENKVVRLLSEVSFSKEGVPFVKRVRPDKTVFQAMDKYLPYTGLKNLTTNKPKYFLGPGLFTPSAFNFAGKQKKPFKPNKPRNKPIEVNGPSVMNTLASFLPTSPNRSKMSITNRLREGYVCMPQTFMYRAFKANTGKSYFNYVMAKNNGGVKNVSPLPPNYSQVSPSYNVKGGGITYVASGTEGATFMGCMDNTCKEKVLIKASVANLPYRDSRPAMEFKINKDIFNKCKDATPHIVMPYIMNICSPEDAFLPMSDKRLSKNKITKDSRLAIGYYEFYNGGNLFSWMERRSKTFTEKQLRTIIFQMLWTMGIMYRKVPSFRHNDLHIQNIFIKTGDNIAKNGNTKYGKLFSVPNVGIMSAVGDFGWAKTDNKPHPNVNSGAFKNSHGISKNTTPRHDVYVFLASLYLFLMEHNKFADTKRFIEKVLGLKENQVINNIRLRANKKSIPTPELMLMNDYFKEFRVKKETAINVTKKSPAKKSTPPQNNKLLSNIKRNIMSTKESDACGKRTAPKQGGIRAMSVEQMMAFIKDNGTPEAKAALDLYKKKPKRSQVCYILTTFRSGRKLAGLTVPVTKNNNKNNSNSNNNNNNNNIEMIALKPKKAITSMNKLELMNFIVSRGGSVPTNATMKNLVGMARAMNNSPRKPVIKKAKTINYVKINASRKAPRREKPAIVPAANKLNATERRMLNTLTNRLFNNMPTNNNANVRRNKARKMAKNKMMALRKRVRNVFGNNTHLNANMTNNLVPPTVRNVAPSNKKMSPVRKTMSPKPRVAKVIRPVNGVVNMYKYTLNNNKNITENKITKGLRVDGKLVRTMPRADINKILRRVGMDPKTVKSKADAAKAVFVKRSKYVKRYQSKKAEEQSAKNFMDQIKKNKIRMENAQLLKIEKARENARKAAEYKFKPSRTAGTLNSNARSKLFSRLGLK